MPSLRNHRQPGPAAWFDAPAGRCLLQAEHASLAGALVSRPGQLPWLWLAPGAEAPESLQLPPGGLRLHPVDGGLAGDVRCALPLPLADEGVGNIFLQHVLTAADSPLLAECARVLEPGGRLWLFTLNPWSPYRLRGLRARLPVPSLLALQVRLQGLGLQACSGGESRLGPVWRVDPDAAGPDWLRAVVVLQVEKRTTAAIPPAPVKPRWQPGAAPA